MLNFKRKQNGAVIVEFAIILPLLAVLAIGVTELGTAFFAQNTLNKAVRDGARLKTYSLDPYLPSTVTPLTDAQIADQIQSVMDGLPSFYAHNATNVPTPIPVVLVPSGTGLQHAQVSATYNHQLLMGPLLGSLLGLFGGNFNSAIPLSATTTMRVQLK